MNVYCCFSVQWYSRERALLSAPGFSGMGIITLKSTSMWRRKVDSEGGVTASKGELLVQEHRPQDKHGMEPSDN